MRLIVDTSVVVATIAGEPERDSLIAATEGAELIAPYSLHWEVGNALSAQLRRGRIEAEAAARFLSSYQRIPIQLVDVGLDHAVEVAGILGIYAYDAYMIASAQKYRCALLTLDRQLARVARRAGVEVLEVNG